jgi:hypothetical protein
MRSIAIGLLVGLGKGLAIGVVSGALLAYVLGWALPPGSLLGYLAAMATAGTAAILGGRAPWSEGAWLVALLKALAGLAVGGLLYWLFVTHADVALPGSLAALLALPETATAGLAAEDGALSWLAWPPLALGAVSAAVGALVELDHAGDADDTSGPERTSPGAKARKQLEDADTVAATEADGPARTRNERRG